MTCWFGIDFGAKLSGNTSICFESDSQLKIIQCQTKVDADQWIVDQIDRIRPDLIFIDAPLSLPGVYRYLKGYKNYHYRRCDLEVKAMSPMFLGGLTARAMALKDRFEIPFYEAYPAAFVRHRFRYLADYKRSHSQRHELLDNIGGMIRFESPVVTNDHQMDALICWVIGWLFYLDRHEVCGAELEGEIFY